MFSGCPTQHRITSGDVAYSTVGSGASKDKDMGIAVGISFRFFFEGEGRKGTPPFMDPRYAPEQTPCIISHQTVSTCPFFGNLGI